MSEQMSVGERFKLAFKTIQDYIEDGGPLPGEKDPYWVASDAVKILPGLFDEAIARAREERKIAEHEAKKSEPMIEPMSARELADENRQDREDDITWGAAKKIGESLTENGDEYQEQDAADIILDAIALAREEDAATIKELREALGWIINELKSTSMEYKPNRDFALEKLVSAFAKGKDA